MLSYPNYSSFRDRLIVIGVPQNRDRLPLNCMVTPIIAVLDIWGLLDGDRDEARFQAIATLKISFMPGTHGSGVASFEAAFPLLIWFGPPVVRSRNQKLKGPEWTPYRSLLKRYST
jgi:hypothetical protein